LDINETVQMSDGRRVPIKDVKVGDEVMTYHPTTFEVSKTRVVNHFIQENTNLSIRLPPYLDAKSSQRKTTSSQPTLDGKL